MVVDGNAFIRRARIFFKALKANSFPNSTSLARESGCSTNTAQRAIYRLRDEYLVPLEYDSSEKGYFLTDPEYLLPQLLPPGKDELTALLLVQDIAKMIGAEDLTKGIRDLWDHFATTNRIVNRDITPLSEVFSCDSTVIGDLADAGLLEFVNAAGTGQDVMLTYESPWRESGEKNFEGRIEQVHFCDGHIYLLFLYKKGRRMVLNASFVKEIRILDFKVEIDGEVSGSENWLEGFGIWGGEKLHDIKVEILPPASKYYAKQRWHAEQSDSWDGEVLVRTFRSSINPELTRRLLSLGKALKSVGPDELKGKVAAHLETMQKALS